MNLKNSNGIDRKMMENLNSIELIQKLIMELISKLQLIESVKKIAMKLIIK